MNKPIRLSLHQMLGKSSSTTFWALLALLWPLLVCFALIYSASFFYYSLPSSLATLSNKVYLSLSYLILSSICSGAVGAKTLMVSNWAWILNGIVNFSYCFSYSFFLFFFLCFFSGYSSSFDFLDWRISSPFSFFHCWSAAILALISAWVNFTSFFYSNFLLSPFKLLR